ncbi:hypothetical protein, partial [Streptomyces sp. NPDC045369]|uniref:hypothetical protein n=1 Tax=Streptomyces sp. NPDC045369 TaxID=3155732 RepID=UPI0033CE59CC
GGPPLPRARPPPAAEVVREVWTDGVRGIRTDVVHASRTDIVRAPRADIVREITASARQPSEASVPHSP